MEILLAILIIRANHVVPLDQLITEIWGDRAPRRATAGLHVYVSQIRKFLHRPFHAESPIVTRPPGYLLDTGSDDIDYHQFLGLVDRGRACAREECHEEATGYLDDALALWRGPVLSDLRQGPITEGFVTWLMETRVECVEMLIDSQLALGHHRELVGRLYSLTAEHPLRESFYRQLMLALYRSERQADSLKVYQTARRTLNDELGLEPCRALQDLQRAILRGDEKLDLCVPA
jgi:DNA-binding SARP family transcriptional activator